MTDAPSRAQERRRLTTEDGAHQPVSHVRQPPGSSLCGHSCLAMVLGLSLEEACERMARRKRGTRTRDLVAALGGAALASRLTTLRKGEALPSTAVLKVVWTDETGRKRGHLVLKVPGAVHDPLSPIALDVDAWTGWISKCGGKVTSFLPVSLVLRPGKAEP